MHFIRIMLKKIISIFSAIAICLSFLSNSALSIFADEKSELDSLESKHFVLMDYNSGKVLYEKDADSKIYPASTTKIWTAFCVLKKCKDVNEVIEIKDMPVIEGSSMYLENGEKFTVLELLEALLIHSSNDVAFVLARHFGDGDANNFIKFMNEEAAKYGATHTHFHNPHGLPDEEHYTTALDMVNLSRVAYGNDIIKKIVAMKEVDFKKSHNCKLDRQMFNSNKFLSSLDNIDYKGKKIPIKYDIVDGIKTGYTDDAGNCLVSTAQKNGSRLICGVFGAPGGALYHDSRMVLDYGFDNFKYVTVFNKKDLKGEKKVKFAKPSTIKYSVANDYTITIPKDKNVDKKDYKTKFNFSNLKLPVKKGDVIGTVSIFDDGNMVSSIGLIAENDSQSYLQYVMSLLPFGKEKNKSEKTDSEKKNAEEKKTENAKSEDKKDSKKEENSKEKDASKENEKTNDDSFVEKVKTAASNSYNGFIAIFSGIGDFFSNLFTSNGIKNIENSNFYKFLDKKISEKVTFIPAKVIIWGVPILILLIVLILLIAIIRDNIKKKKNKKSEKKKSKNKKQSSNKEEINIKKEKVKNEVSEKKEMSVDDIIAKEDESKTLNKNNNTNDITQETKRIPIKKDN